MARTERVEFRLSVQDQDLLDHVRGPSTRSAWLRNQIHRAADDQNGETDDYRITPTPKEEAEDVLDGASSVTELPKRGVPKASRLRDRDIEDPPITHPGLGNHRHKPKTLLNTYYDRGTLRKVWLCDCGETVRR